jgi:phosphoglycolate phosphatase-like HAD superfamily hydrolase
LEEPSTPDPTSEFSTLGERLGKEFDELYIGLTDVKTAPLYDGMRQLVVDVADVGNVKLAALSNAAVAYVQRVIQVHELAPLFAILHGADDVPAPKPSGDGLILTCKELGERICNLWVLMSLCECTGSRTHLCNVMMYLCRLASRSRHDQNRIHF